MLLRLSALPSMWRWGLSFIRNCSLDRYREAAGINLRLANHTLALIKDIRAEAAIEYDLSQKGTLKIYTRREAMDKNVAESVCEAARAGVRGRSMPLAALRSSRRWLPSVRRWWAASTPRPTSTATAKIRRSVSGALREEATA